MRRNVLRTVFLAAALQVVAPCPLLADDGLLALSAELSSADVSRRRCALDSAARLGERARPLSSAILAIFLRGEDVLRPDALAAYAQIEGARSLRILREAAGDSDWSVRQIAVRSLGNVGDGRVEPLLLDALEDERQPVRWDALIALSKHEGPAAGCRKRAQEDEDESIRRLARKLCEEGESGSNDGR